jgi:hypothetical protein
MFQDKLIRSHIAPILQASPYPLWLYWNYIFISLCAGSRTKWSLITCYVILDYAEMTVALKSTCDDNYFTGISDWCMRIFIWVWEHNNIHYHKPCDVCLCSEGLKMGHSSGNLFRGSSFIAAWQCCENNCERCCQTNVLLANYSYYVQNKTSFSSSVGSIDQFCTFASSYFLVP